ncbi:unnamed protein product, partial [Iphiclides podalirius]
MANSDVIEFCTANNVGPALNGQNHSAHSSQSSTPTNISTARAIRRRCAECIATTSPQFDTDSKQVRRATCGGRVRTVRGAPVGAMGASSHRHHFPRFDSHAALRTHKAALIAR